MSARPRPVTATIIPASLAPPTGVRTRSYSLSSGASTESLVSVLDHDSYESLGEISDNEHVPCDSKKNERQNGSSHIHSTVQDTTYTTSTVPERPASAPSPNKNAASLTWEKWMVLKAKEVRRKQKQQIAQTKQQEEEEKKKMQEKQEKQKIGEQKIKEWVEKKDLSNHINRKMKIRQEQAKREIEEIKQAEVRQKANRKFEEWKEKKAREEAEQRQNQKEKQQKEEEEKEERRKKCQEEFDKWCKKVQNRPKSVHSSLGYTSGKLTGYYDTSAYPMPSFYNPRPWIPNDIPTTAKQQKKRSKSARRWNPAKYF